MEQKVFFTIMMFVTFTRGGRISNTSPLGIVGGKIETIPENRWFATVVINDTSGGFERYCAGTIVTTKIVLTAAQCFVSNNPYKVYVRLGSDDIHRGGKIINASFIIKHRNFSDINFGGDYDIAIIVLKKTFQTGVRYGPINLSSLTHILPINGTGKACGFGYEVTLNGNKHRHFKCADLYIGSTCEAKSNSLENKVICAGNATKNICHNEIGAGLIVDGKLVGVFSSLGSNDCKKPSGFTSLTTLNYWFFQDPKFYSSYTELIVNMAESNRAVRVYFD